MQSVRADRGKIVGDDTPRVNDNTAHDDKQQDEEGRENIF
jgi:hypothetical protein